MDVIAGHRDLMVWKKGIILVKDIYAATEKFPSTEKYNLVSQINRCVCSIPANIAEGCGRRTPKELVQFLNIALGSCAELDTHITIANELGYLSNEVAKQLIDSISEETKMLVALMAKIKLQTTDLPIYS